MSERGEGTRRDDGHRLSGNPVLGLRGEPFEGSCFVNHGFWEEETRGAPAEPLVARLVARSTSTMRWYAELAPNAGAAGTWGGRWQFDAITIINGVSYKQSDDAFTVSAWVGGPNYVTADTPQTFVAAP